MTYTGCRGRRSAEFSEGSVYDVIEYFLLYFARVRPDFHHCNPANRRLYPSPTGHGRHLLLNGGKIPVVALGHIRELQASRLIPGVSAGAGQRQEVHPLTAELLVNCVGYARAVGAGGIEAPVLGQSEGQSVDPDLPGPLPLQAAGVVADPVDLHEADAQVACLNMAR